MYYVIKVGPATQDAATIYRDAIPGHEEVSFTKGSKLGQLPPLTLRKRKGDGGGLVDHMIATPYTMVVSARLKDALQSAGVDNVDYYPAQIIEEKTGAVASNYFVANIIGLISCVDWEKSNCRVMSAFPADFRGQNCMATCESLRLDESKIQGAKMFRLFEKTSVVLVNDSVKQVIDKAGLTGIRAIPAEGLELP